MPGSWNLDGFTAAFHNLPGPVSRPLAKAYADFLALLAADPVSPSEQIDSGGPHLGETLTGEEREAPFPPRFRTVVQAADGPDVLLCTWVVDPDAWTASCVDLEHHPG